MNELVVNKLRLLRYGLAKADSGNKVVSDYAAAMQWFGSGESDVLGEHMPYLNLVYIKLCLHKFAVNGWRFNECSGWSKHECSQFLSELGKTEKREHASERDRTLTRARLYNFVYGLESPAVQLYAFGLLLGREAKLNDADINFYKACMEGRLELTNKDAAGAKPSAVAD